MIRAETQSVPEIVNWYYDAATRWPDVFSVATLCRRFVTIAGGLVPPEANEQLPEFHAELARRLRAVLLHELRLAIGACQQCPLHLNRLRGRPVVEDGEPANDRAAGTERPVPIGGLSADVLLVGGHPDEWDQRTGQPFTSTTVLMGSTCATGCKGYEGCFPRGVTRPAAPCRPTGASPSDLTRLAEERARVAYWSANPTAQVLDQALTQADEWRTSWNGRQSRLETVKTGTEPREATVAITTLVKCPTCPPEGGPAITPQKAELAACQRWLGIQQYVIQPLALVALGKLAEAVLTVHGHEVPITAARAPAWIVRQADVAGETAQLAAAIRAARAGIGAVPSPTASPAAATRLAKDTAVTAPPPAGFTDIQQASFVETYGAQDQWRAEAEGGNEEQE